jgi:CubicO group peptidase (beta-lactamase class C family)
MYILASYIISQCSSKSFPAFVKQNIFDPLNMSSTTYSPTLAQQSGKKTQTWSLNGRRIPYFLAEEDVELNAGAGGVISSVYDLVRILSPIHEEGN